MEDLTMLSSMSNSSITANLSARLTREEIYTALGGCYLIIYNDFCFFCFVILKSYSFLFCFFFFSTSFLFSSHFFFPPTQTS